MRYNITFSQDLLVMLYCGPSSNCKLFLALLDQCTPDGFVHASLSELETYVGSTRHDISRRLRQLEEVGLLQICSDPARGKSYRCYLLNGVTLTLPPTPPRREPLRPMLPRRVAC